MDFTHVAILASVAVVAVHQILKLNVIPIAFANRYPVPTNIALSIIASVIAVWQSNQLSHFVWTNWVQLIATVAVIAAITYNQLLAKWDALQAIEGEGKVTAPAQPQVVVAPEQPTPPADIPPAPTN